MVPPNPLEPEDRCQRNFTDPDSRIMPDKDKAFVQAYSAQAVVDSNSQVIVGCDVGNNASDSVYLKAVVEQSVESLGRSPEELSAHAGYYSDSNVMWLREHKIAPFISTTKTRHTARAVSPRGPISPDMSLRDRMTRWMATKAREG